LALKRIDDTAELASIVSHVTETMLGIRFVAAPDGAEPDGGLFWKNAALPIAGANPLVIAVSADAAGCRALSGAMFSCSGDQVDESMMNDSLCELANMTAGLLKSALGLDQALGLPRIRDAHDLFGARPPQEGCKRHLLRADHLNLVLSIVTGI